MEHLVRFTTSEGREGQHQAPSLDDALQFVERLRNSGEASDARVFRVQEVPISFRAYYKVELTAEPAPAGSPAAPADAQPAPDSAPGTAVDAPPAPVQVTEVPAPDATEANGRRLFSRS